MADLKQLSIQIKNYKCFDGNGVGFDSVFPMNLIIGRNNSGKSSLLDLIQFGIKGGLPDGRAAHGHKGIAPTICLTMPLTLAVLQQVFEVNVSGGPIRGNHLAFGRQFIDARLTWELRGKEKPKFVSIDSDNEIPHEYRDRLAQAADNPLKKLFFRKISAARDIAPEIESRGNLAINENGQGATNVVQSFLNTASLDNRIVERDLLRALNSILVPDANFERILCRVVPNGSGQELWEMFFQRNDQLIHLSEMGSGIKTILLVLINLLIVPKAEGHPIDSYAFAFEELENNLHPALQRRLFLYLRDFAVKNGCKFFLTTHSNIPIDLFSDSDDAQIIHVTHDGDKAITTQSTTFLHGKSILEDLEFRASDLLQSNGIVWVEGPSDRIYLNRWIGVESGGALKDGVHYQCMFYGGRLLAHLSGEEELPADELDSRIQILRINKNAAILIDSDKKTAAAGINATKARIKEEFASMGAYCWISGGREVENYIPENVLKAGHPDGARPLGRYESLADYLEEVEEGRGEKFKSAKVEFARQIAPSFNAENIASTLDLKVSVTKLIQEIKRWNGLV